MKVKWIKDNDSKIKESIIVKPLNHYIGSSGSHTFMLEVQEKTIVEFNEYIKSTKEKYEKYLQDINNELTNQLDEFINSLYQNILEGEKVVIPTFNIDIPKDL